DALESHLNKGKQYGRDRLNRRVSRAPERGGQEKPRTGEGGQTRPAPAPEGARASPANAPETGRLEDNRNQGWNPPRNFPRWRMRSLTYVAQNFMWRSPRDARKDASLHSTKRHIT